MSLGREIRFEQEDDGSVSVTDALGVCMGELSLVDTSTRSEWWFFAAEDARMCADELQAIVEMMRTMNAHGWRHPNTQ